VRLPLTYAAGAAVSANATLD